MSDTRPCRTQPQKSGSSDFSLHHLFVCVCVLLRSRMNQQPARVPRTRTTCVCAHCLVLVSVATAEKHFHCVFAHPCRQQMVMHRLLAFPVRKDKLLPLIFCSHLSCFVSLRARVRHLIFFVLRRVHSSVFRLPPFYPVYTLPSLRSRSGCFMALLWPSVRHLCKREETPPHKFSYRPFPTTIQISLPFAPDLCALPS